MKRPKSTHPNKVREAHFQSDIFPTDLYTKAPTAVQVTDRSTHFMDSSPMHWSAITCTITVYIENGAEAHML